MDLQSHIQGLQKLDDDSLLRSLKRHVGSGWAAVAQSNAAWVRQLEPGDGRTRAPSAPDDWHEALAGELGVEEHSAPAPREVGPQAPTARLDSVDGERLGASVRYRVQFTADQAYVDLLEQARALLWHRLPSGDLAQLHRLALEALVEKLVSRKYGAGARSGVSVERAGSAAADLGRDGAPAGTARPSLSETRGSPAAPTPDEGSVATKTSNVVAAEVANSARHELEPSDVAAPARSQAPTSNTRPKPDHDPPATSSRGNSRHVPAAARSAVWLRDEARCTFVDARGVRCRATTALELHHERPFARGGRATADNIRLRCRAHNELAAEQDFGRELMLTRKHGPPRPDMPTP